MITKQQVEWLIERLAETKKVKCASCEQACDEDESCSICHNVPQAVTIGTVLDKIVSEEDDGANDFNILYLTKRWKEFGLSKSIQEIIAESGYKEESIPPEGWDDGSGGCSCHINPPCAYCEYSTYEEVITSPKASALLAFILHLLPENNE